MKVRFLADSNLHLAIIEGVCRNEPEVDFKRASEANLHGQPDMEVLAIAAEEGRILVTHDIRTMPLHFAEFVETNESAGVLLVAQRASIGAAIREVAELWRTTEAKRLGESDRPPTACSFRLTEFASG